MIGLQRSTVSPCSSSISRSTPWVLGCCGPMLMIIVWSSSGSSGRSPSCGRLGLAHPQHRADLAQQLLGRHLDARLELLAVLRRLRRIIARRQRGTATSVIDARRASLNCTGICADLVVLAQRVALPVLRHQDAGQVGVVGERDAEHVVHLALHRLGAGMDVEQRRQRRVVGSGTWTRTRMRRPAVDVEEVGDDLEALGRRRRRAAAGRGGRGSRRR